MGLLFDSAYKQYKENERNYIVKLIKDCEAGDKYACYKLGIYK